MADDLLQDGIDLFKEAADHEEKNRERYREDIRFALKSEQWDSGVLKDRERDGRPAMTFNTLPTYIRQVSNDIRQNKPAITPHAAEGGDKETANVIKGLIKNIEYTSDAHVAYHTAAESAVAGGVGYWTVDVDYTRDDSFDLDIQIKRKVDAMAVYGDPTSTAADSSDWMNAFETETVHKDKFEDLYDTADKIDWEIGEYSTKNMAHPWRDGDSVMVAYWWRREEVSKTLYQLRSQMGKIFVTDDIEAPDIAEMLATGQAAVMRERPSTGYKVRRITMSGAEVLAEEDWLGKFIPIVPVYGQEIWYDGERELRSLIHDAKDAAREKNFWHTTASELAALQPKSPFIGPEIAFSGNDQKKWALATKEAFPFISYKGTVAPQRQPMDFGPATGALQQALNANDHIKAILGMFDASMGARSNETSGRAILARQRESDVSTFHFSDNVNRALRHTGRIILDLIPHVYSEERMIRVIGDDEKETAVKINTPMTELNDDGVPVEKIHDLTAAKYDVTVKAGPSYTTQREEMREVYTEMLRVFPASAPVVAPLILQNMDTPGSDEVAEKLEKLAGGGIPDEVKKQIKEGAERLAQLERENAQLKADRQVEAAELQLKNKEIGVKEYEAITRRIIAEQKRMEVEAEQIAQVDPETGLPGVDILARVLAAQMAPKRVVRDEFGEIAGVETVVPDGAVNAPA